MLTAHQMNVFEEGLPSTVSSGSIVKWDDQMVEAYLGSCSDGVCNYVISIWITVGTNDGIFV